MQASLLALIFIAFFLCLSLSSALTLDKPANITARPNILQYLLWREDISQNNIAQAIANANGQVYWDNATGLPFIPDAWKAS